ncbi:MAG: hypothetical protein ACC657_04950 [Thiohalomonadales bacterium]
MTAIYFIEAIGSLEKILEIIFATKNIPINIKAYPVSLGIFNPVENKIAKRKMANMSYAAGSKSTRELNTIKNQIDFSCNE